MTMLKEILNSFPGRCHVGKKIPQKLFLANEQLSAGDKRLVKNNIKEVMVQYQISAMNSSVESYADNERQYNEVLVIEARIKIPRQLNQLTEMIHRSIPNPVFLIVAYGDEYRFSVADKRINQADDNKRVVEDIISSEWIGRESENGIERDFTKSFSGISGATNLFLLYQDLKKRVIALILAAHTGRFRLESPLTVDEQVKLFRKIDELEKLAVGLRLKLKGEKQLGRQVEINVQIKNIEDKIYQSRSLIQ